MADRPYLRLAILTAVVLTASWTLYFYMTSVTGFDQSLLNGEIETSAVVVAGVVIVTLVTKYYLPRLSQN